MITTEKLAQWHVLCEKATPGPWQISKEFACHVVISHGETPVAQTDCITGRSDESRAEMDSTAEFIATSRTALPEAIAEIAKLRAILERSVEWWLREGVDKFYGSPEWMFAAREVIR